MEEIINKPESQFKDILNDLIDYSKDSEEKSALIKEVCLARHPTKPPASLNSSLYSSAASSSSSTSSASDSSTNSASSSTTSTISSPSQSNQERSSDANNSRVPNLGLDIDIIEVAKMEDLGKTARILEHRLAISSEAGTTTNDVTASHSHIRSTRLVSKSTSPASTFSHKVAHQSTKLSDDTKLSDVSSMDTNLAYRNPEPWKTISGKRDKRRKKPVEQPVLSEHIPGHKGEQEVDWLVKFIESGAPGPNNMGGSSNKKIAKNTKQQSKRSHSQIMEHRHASPQRKPNNKPTSTHLKSLLHVKQSSGPSISSQSQPSNQTEAITAADCKPQRLEIQKSVLVSPLSSNGCKAQAVKSKVKRNSDIQHEKQAQQNVAAVTFADHISINEDVSNCGYIFGFFDEQKHTEDGPVEYNKPAIRHYEDISPRFKRAGQKHKPKHLRACPDSEQKLNKFHDNIDATSFNYQQILEFISNSWENTAKSHQLTARHDDLA